MLFPISACRPTAPIGPRLDLCVVYSIVRTESAFDQRDKSPAKAVGLMQVTPKAGRDTAKRFGVAYDWNGLVSDPVYNTQMGAAEVAALLKEYRGSYIMTFAGYNAGRGRVRQWVAQHGRSARSQGRRGRLGRAHSDSRDAQLRPACVGEPAGLPRALRCQRRDGRA
jgi:soluble lytic murein transglycosylase-like protein